MQGMRPGTPFQNRTRPTFDRHRARATERATAAVLPPKPHLATGEADAPTCRYCGTLADRRYTPHNGPDHGACIVQAKDCGHMGLCACVKYREPLDLDAYYKSEQDG